MFIANLKHKIALGVDSGVVGPLECQSYGRSEGTRFKDEIELKLRLISVVVQINSGGRRPDI